MLGGPCALPSIMLARRVSYHGWKRMAGIRNLHTTATLPQAEKHEHDTSTVDSAVESLVNQTAKIREREAQTDWRAIFLPNSRHFLFEGAEGDNDYIVFREHEGPRNWRHARRTCCIADLAKSSTPGQDHEQLERIFQQQMEVIRQIYNEKEDGVLNLTAKFGHLYLVDSRPWHSMSVSDFNDGIQSPRNSRNALSTSFAPITTPSQHTVNVLLNAGFSETKQEESVVVSIEHPLKQRWQKKRLEIYLDHEFMFQSLRQADRCFLNVDIRRQNRPDIRLALKSVDEEFAEENIDYPGLLYARDHLLFDHDVYGITLDESIIGRATIVRRKKITTCKLSPDRATTNFDQALEVKLIDTMYYENPKADGTFDKKNKLTEVYVCITGRDQLFRLYEDKHFLQRLLKVCDKFQ